VKFRGIALALSANDVIAHRNWTSSLTLQTFLRVVVTSFHGCCSA